MPFVKHREPQVLSVLYLDRHPRDRGRVVKAAGEGHAPLSVAVAGTADEFESLVHAGPWGVILADIDVPSLDIHRVIDIASSAAVAIPVVVVTASTGEAAAIAAVEQGASDYVLKTAAHLRRLPSAITSAAGNAEHRNASERIRQMLERTERNARIGSWEWEIATGLVRWSPGMYRLHGMDIGQSPPPFASQENLYGPGEYPRLRDAAQRVVDIGTDFEIDLDFVTGEGATRHGLVRGLPLKDAAGGVTHVYGSLQDMTELRGAERALRDQERQYRALVDNTRDVIWSTDLNTVFTYVNPSIERLMQYPPEEVIGRSVAEFCTTDVFARIGEILRNQLELGPGSGGVVVEMPLLRRDGSEIMLEVSALVVYDDNGTPLYVQGSSRDIGERVQMQAERERLLQAIRQAGETIVITDVNAIIEYVNPEFERITGYSAAEAIGRNARMLSSGKQDQAFYESMWSAIKSGRTWKGQFVNQRKDGTLFTEAATISAVRDANGRITNFVAVKRDITARLELEQRLRQAHKMEAIGRLAGGVAHDFNNMLGVILGYARQAQSRLAPDHPAQRSLREIASAGERSAELTRQLLGFARQQMMAPEVIDLNESVQGMVSLLRRMVREDIELHFRPGERVCPVEIDPTQLHQILTNLVVNARDAIPRTGRIIIETGTAEFDSKYCEGHPGFRTGSFSRVSVNDDGEGMDRDTLSHIFEPFFTTKGPSQGTGLGLATTYGIVKQNDGFVNVYSEPGRGTTINVYLPSRAGTVVQAPHENAHSAPRGSETVLLVEDETALLELSVSSLEELGYRVFAASTPGRAVELAREHGAAIDLLMTDVVMPEMSGRELWDLLRGKNSELKCLFVSGYPADVVRDRGRLEEGVHFLQKPFVVDALASKLRDVLDG